jgi:hypothetical protein
VPDDDEHAESSDDELVIVADIAETEPDTGEARPDEALADGVPDTEDPWGDTVDDATQAMPAIDTERSQRDEDDFRFSFDDDRA